MRSCIFVLALIGLVLSSSPSRAEAHCKDSLVTMVTVIEEEAPGAVVLEVIDEDEEIKVFLKGVQGMQFWPVDRIIKYAFPNGNGVALAVRGQCVVAHAMMYRVLQQGA